MIKYALQCDKGHGFESWFPSSASYDIQVKRKLVDCPTCGSTTIEKQIMAPNVRLRNLEVPAQGGPSDSMAVAAAPAASMPAPSMSAPSMSAPSMSAPSMPVAMSEPLPQLMSEPMQQLRAMVKEMHAHVQANTEDVGSKFAEEAQKIHYGESEERAIRGSATADEIEILHDEGIPFMPLPTLPDERN